MDPGSSCCCVSRGGAFNSTIKKCACFNDSSLSSVLLCDEAWWRVRVCPCKVSPCRGTADETFIFYHSCFPDFFYFYMGVAVYNPPCWPKFSYSAMSSKVVEDFSDSESDCGSSGGDIESSVQLGIPDGSISSQSDLLDPCVSRIGGRPVRAIHSCTFSRNLIFISGLCHVIRARSILFTM